MNVPDVPLAAIREAARHRTAVRPALVSKALFAGLGTSAFLAAAAIGAEMLGFSHLSLDRSGALQIATNGCAACAPIFHPTRREVTSVIRRADFPVTLPAGLPGAAAPNVMMEGSPSAVLFSYDLPGVWRRSDHVLYVVLANPKAFDPSTALEHPRYRLLISPGSAVRKARWAIGREIVFVWGDHVTAAELAHMKRAMLAASASP